MMMMMMILSQARFPSDHDDLRTACLLLGQSDFPHSLHVESGYSASQPSSTLFHPLTIPFGRSVYLTADSSEVLPWRLLALDGSKGRVTGVSIHQKGGVKDLPEDIRQAAEEEQGGKGRLPFSTVFVKGGPWEFNACSLKGGGDGGEVVTLVGQAVVTVDGCDVGGFGGGSRGVGVGLV